MYSLNAVWSPSGATKSSAVTCLPVWASTNTNVAFSPSAHSPSSQVFLTSNSPFSFGFVGIGVFPSDLLLP